MTLYFKQKMSSAVHNHGRHDGFGAGHAVNFRLAFEFPDISAILLFNDVDMELIARQDGFPELGLIYRQEVDELAFQRLASRMNDQRPCRLGHSLDDKNARHYRC